MHIFYIDDSKDEVACVFSALSVPEDRWKEAFRIVKDFRIALKGNDGILLRVELHATDLVAGRGHLGPRIVPKGRRCQILQDALGMVSTIPCASLINGVAPKDKEGWLFERLLNRINTAMEGVGSHALIISDQGKEQEYTRLTRRMAVFNPFLVNLEIGEAEKRPKIFRLLRSWRILHSRIPRVPTLSNWPTFALTPY